MTKRLVFICMCILSYFNCGVSANNSTKIYPKYVYKNVVDNVNENETSLIETKSDITFMAYNRNHPDGFQIVISNTYNQLKTVFIQNVSAIFITHGWLASEKHRTVDDIKDALFKRKDINIISVGWSPISRNEYMVTTFRVAGVGVTIGKMVKKLLDVGLTTLDYIHLIGHSLGAHVMGIAGGFIRDSGFGKVGRVTGLDPAKPLYELTSGENSRLDSGDAQFVDVIHSCAGVFGYMEALGHADFYPNGGYNPQPGCEVTANVFCSHIRAIEYFVESIYNEVAFPSVQCESYMKYELNLCHSENFIYMGYSTNQSARGNFYLETSRTKPYGRNISYTI